jgi:hypothetical protein
MDLIRFKQRLQYLTRVLILAWVLMGLGLPTQAQLRCPLPDPPDRDYGTACGGKGRFLFGGTITPFAVTGNQIPGNASGSNYRIPASTSPSTTTRLTDAQLQSVIYEGRRKFDAQLDELLSHFATSLDYRGAADCPAEGCRTVQHFIDTYVKAAEESRDYFLAAAMSHPENTCLNCELRPAAEQAACRARETGPRGATCAVTGLFNAMELLTQRWTVRGNEILVRTYDQYRATHLDLLDVNRGLQQAQESFQNAVAAYTKYFHRPLPLGPSRTIYDALLREQFNRTDAYTRTPFRDLRLLAEAAGRKAFTRREWGHHLYALANYDAAYELMPSAELESVGELLTVSALYPLIDARFPIREEDPPEVQEQQEQARRQAREPINNALRELLAERSKITELLRYLEGGKNVLGLDNDYVEILLPREATRTNFEEVARTANTQLTAATDLYTQFTGTQRQFDQSVEAYQMEAQRRRDYYDAQKQGLCGPPPHTDRCTGGALQQAHLDVEQANLKIQLVLQEISNLEQRIQFERDHRDELVRLGERLRELEISNGNERANLLDELAKLQAEKAQAAAATQAAIQEASAPPECDPPPPAQCGFPEDCSGSEEEVTRCREQRSRCLQDQLRCRQIHDQRVAAYAAAAAAREGGSRAATLERRTGEIQVAMERLQALQRARFSEEQEQMLTIDLNRFIKTTTLDIITKGIELRMAELARTQAVGRLDDLTQQWRRTLAEEQVWLGITRSQDVVRNPALRVIQDRTLRNFLIGLDNAQRWTYLTGRALIYEFNTCPGPTTTCPAIVQNLDDVLKIVDISDLRAKVNTMDLAFTTSRPPTTDQFIPVDLSRLLGFKAGMVNGRMQTAKEQFKRCWKEQVEGRGVPPECPIFDVRNPNPMTGFYRTVVLPFRIELGEHLQRFEGEEYQPVVSPLYANLKILSIKARIEGPAPSTIGLFNLNLSYGLTDEQNSNLVGSMSQRDPNSNVSFASTAGVDIVHRYNAKGIGATTIQAGVGRRDWTAIQTTNPQFVFRALGFSDYVLIVTIDPTIYPDNPRWVENNLGTIEDIAFEFKCSAANVRVTP